MAFREKIAWLTLLAMLIAYSIYFGLILSRPEPPTMLGIIWLFGTISLAQLVVVIAGSIAIAVLSGREARARADERERAIARRGARAAYYVLMAGMILAGVVMPFSEPPWKIVNTALLALVIAEAVNNIVVLMSYRRGWHG
ncbi:hypothetical protein ACFQ1E_07015 [Sphingomonas canadensis]|uniref:DUF2178 domain-containing protein n=1 Tax=Sphingomonas canadensis TaxID=1219257 RepID=A0ABW3H5F5_9SPHN|nr:hypothetical protein [Sphingomonas canadensis]MCW3835461.1 hypothetical protein [Sphingomonas canadensis]